MCTENVTNKYTIQVYTYIYAYIHINIYTNWLTKVVFSAGIYMDETHVANKKSLSF